MPVPDGVGPSIDGAAAQAARRVLDWLAGIDEELDGTICAPADVIALDLLCHRVIGGAPEDPLDAAQRWTGGQELDLTAGSLLSGLLVATEVRRRRAGSDLVRSYFAPLSELKPDLEAPTRGLVDAALGEGPGRESSPSRRGDVMPVALDGAGDLDAALGLVEAETRFGLLPARLDPIDRILLEGEMIYAFQRKDVGLALRAMRALLYVEATDSLGFRSARTTLHALQWSDGTFGDYQRRAGDMRLLSGRVGLAFAVIWTMAEMEGDRFRLVRDMLTPA